MYATLKKAQPRALQIIENSKINNRLSHAYLFTGPKGTYKKEMAYYLAMMLYCKENKPCYKFKIRFFEFIMRITLDIPCVFGISAC